MSIVQQEALLALANSLERQANDTVGTGLPFVRLNLAETRALIDLLRGLANDLHSGSPDEQLLVKLERAATLQTYLTALVQRLQHKVQLYEHHLAPHRRLFEALSAVEETTLPPLPAP